MSSPEPLRDPRASIADAARIVVATPARGAAERGGATYLEWRVVWPDGSVLPCDGDEDLARRWARRTASYRDPTPRFDPWLRRSLPGTVQVRRVTHTEWRDG